MSPARSLLALALLALLVFAPYARAADEEGSETGVRALFDLTSPSGGPFPSDVFTVLDDSQATGLRVNLPASDCAARPSDCEDIAILNELDGFNVQPRLSIPFSGPIDVDTVNSETVFLLPLASGDAIGINQIVWDVETSTLHVESDRLLDQQATYVLIVTRAVRDAAGERLEASGRFQSFRHGTKVGHGDDAYRDALLAGLERAAEAGVDLNDVAVASVFTTMSVTPWLEQIREQIRAAEAPAPADLVLGDPNRSVQTVFPLSAISGMTVNEQVTTTPTFASFTPRLALLRIIPGAVGTVAFGSYRSPVYLNGNRFIPQVGTGTGTPVVQGTDEIFFNLFLPAATAERPRPEGGWPVAIYMSGCCAAENKNGTPLNVAATLANQGIATISINAAGQGSGPLSTFTVRLASGAVVTFPAGGRSLDVNGDGAIGPGEGTDATNPRRILLGRDARLQTIADLMQLVRVIEVGIDADGDESPDLDASRIYYAGWSAGAQAGAPFVAVEPTVRAAVLNAAGGLVGERLRLSPVNRGELGALLAARVPSLINVGGSAFNENLPLRNEDPIINLVPGAVAIQEVLERIEWASMPADPAAFAPFLQKTPLPGAAARPLIVQFARGDQTVPNPSTTAMLRAGDLAGSTTYYRTDVAVCTYGVGPAAPPPNPPPGVENNGHNFLVRMNAPIRTAIARATQEQIVLLFKSDGTTVIDPDTVWRSLAPRPPEPPPLFEVPIAEALPEDLDFVRADGSDCGP